MSHWLAICRFSKQQLGNSAPWCPQNQRELSTVGDPDTGLGADCSNELQGPRDWVSSVYVLRHFEGVWGQGFQRSRTPHLGSKGTFTLAGNKTRPCHTTPDCRACRHWGHGAWVDEHWRAILHTDTIPSGAGFLKICLHKWTVFHRSCVFLLSPQNVYGELKQHLKLGFTSLVY